jgi:hypothetical protein
MTTDNAMLRWSAAALICAVASAAGAGEPPSATAVLADHDRVSAKPDRHDDPPSAFHSVLDGYRPYRADEPLRDWREINDEVGRLGGHRGALGDAAAASDSADHSPMPDAAR